MQQRKLLRDTELVEQGLSPWGVSKLRQDRHFGRGLPYIKVGFSVFYCRDEVVAWFEKFKVTPEE